MAVVEPIHVKGLVEFQRSLKAVDKDLPRALRVALKAAGQIVFDDGKPKIPVRTGRLKKTAKLRAEQRRVRILFGGDAAPYGPWTDFGGTRRGRGGGEATIPFRSRGRFFWLSFHNKQKDVTEALDKSLRELAERAGLEVSHGG